VLVVPVAPDPDLLMIAVVCTHCYCRMQSQMASKGRKTSQSLRQTQALACPVGQAGSREQHGEGGGAVDPRV